MLDISPTIFRITFRRTSSITYRRHFLGTERRCAVASANPRHHGSWRAADVEETYG
jgi:hypothetical protein